MKAIKKYYSTTPTLVLWIFIIIFALVTIWIIRVFDNQDNQDQDRFNRQMSYQINTN
jgi:hypothetical protein